MINTKIYKAVYALAEKLMKAAAKDDREAFDALYADLKALCIANENSDKDHPEQWETLADFTESLDEALVIYQQALEKAVATLSHDHIASIGYSMATLQVEMDQPALAIKRLEQAQASALNIEDNDLKTEIDDLLDQLTQHQDPHFDQ